ncbi:TPA: ATP-binding protein, partial [Escherichia coli]|nr:ATP-binding protein [Escherichia coli]HDS9489544.1 ATP-binding protein [Escherichia coli]HDW1764223.1 ATP-binding protein [Escherichia coli]HDW1797961.1 ATP-binding protein [Escherichia coli]HDW3286375.1 ATP-binding protein [Escherichia coli]
MKLEKAKYRPAILPEHRGNPLIEALPAKHTDEELVDKLSFYPPHSFEETQLAPFERVEYLTRLKDLRQPLPIYLDCFRAVEMAIKEGYSVKNPLSPTTMNYLHYPTDRRPNIEPRTGYFKPKGCGITVIGESGVGKTCMLEQILGCFPDTIEHSQYKNHSIPLRQVVWIKVDCPDDSSVRALCHKILSELDSKLGFEPTKRAGTIPLLLDQIEARIKSSFLGILVIDEMQNLNLAKTGGADRLLGFIHNLVNNLGIPILFCANPPFNQLLSRTLKAARRAESNGYFDVVLME